MGKKLVIKGADFSVNGIPPEFVELKCIIATNTSQAIISPVDFPVKGRIVSDVFIPSEIAAGYGSILGRGEMTSTWANELRVEYFDNSTYANKLFVYANNGINAFINSTVQSGRHTLDVSRTFAYVDGSSVGTLPTPSGEQSAVSDFGVFGKCKGQGGSVVYQVLAGLKLYSCKMYSDRDDNNSLILDLVPVKRIADNKVGLYDKISGEYLFCKDGTNPNYE
jgi:hypothetical protein